MSREKSQVQNKEIILPPDVLCHIFDNITSYKEIQSTIVSSPQLKDVAYKCVRIIDFVGVPLVKDDQSNAEQITNFVNPKLDLERYIGNFSRLKFYRAALNMVNVKNLRYALSDVKAKHIFVRYYDEDMNTIIPNMLEALELRVEKYGREFTFVFEYPDKFMFFYKNGVFSFAIWSYEKMYIDEILSMLDIYKVVNLPIYFHKRITEYPEINTLLYNLCIDDMDVIPNNIKYVYFKPDFVKYGDTIGLSKTIDNYDTLCENVEILEYPIFIREETPIVFPNVKVFHSVYEYLLKMYEYRYNKRNGSYDGMYETDTYKYYEKLYREDILEGKEFGIEVFNYIDM